MNMLKPILLLLFDMPELIIHQFEEAVKALRLRFL